MNRSTLTRKRVLVPAVAVLALGVGGTAWATTAAADQVGGGERDRVSRAALEVTGGGDVTSVEASDGDDRARGEAYEVEVRQPDGTEVDLTLGADLGVLEQDVDRPDGTDDETADADADDRVLSADERDRAERAALGAVEGAANGGRVLDVEASDADDSTRGVAYDVEVLGADGVTEWDVELADDFAVVDSRQDR